MFAFARLLLALPLLVSCAALHHVQVGDLDARKPGQAFSLKVSEAGIDLQQVGGIAKALSRNKHLTRKIEEVQAIVALFQMGPKTGYPIYTDTYAENMLAMLQQECPSGKITGLVAVRESREYPVISGEIVKINGYCLQ